MGDLPDVQITPETPGRAAIRNPFESPNDYHRLQESVVPSPSVFKSSKTSGTTPAKFKWDIDEMSILLPVDIDAEDIHRQSLYLSQTRMDSDIEEKRQNAIEQFFTKGAIVPSPWSEPTSKQKSAQMHFGKSSMSPLILEEPLPTKKTTVGCQTVLSLPVDFLLDKILGEYYRLKEVSQQDQVQETLSSSSLRRKLFLDGQGSGSESSNPPSPEGGGGGGEGEPPGGEGGGDRDFLSPMSASPLSCPLSGRSALTPSTGLFSSSPIQGRYRTYSLGSVTSPLCPERSSPAGFQSPALSPIGPQFTQTPVAGERRKLSFVTPEGVPLDMDINSCTESPYVDGCSPIRFCSSLQPPGRTQVNPQLRPGAHCWASPQTISPNPSLLDQGNICPSTSLPPMEMGSCSPSPVPCVPRTSGGLLGMERLCDGGSGIDQPLLDSVKMEEEEVEENGEVEEEEEEGGVTPVGVRLTSSRVGASVMAAEASHMFVSLLAEGSSIPYDNSMQVDSGYNTYAGTASLIDAMSSDSQSKESFDAAHNPDDVFPHSRHTKTKTVFPQHH
ncbi:protein aurora borealis isoform X2 [Oncorhynchus mykiss]|uniref:protein aurora borealis isoform X2 n=1 Tax=Oncorhynchus mykiss TaxID=8022 RepID=UPI001878731B|nr:protein aurora borealis isoform X2 [Oncorhynchus mykiss]